MDKGGAKAERGYPGPRGVSKTQNKAVNQQTAGSRRTANHIQM